LFVIEYSTIQISVSDTNPMIPKFGTFGGRLETKILAPKIRIKLRLASIGSIGMFQNQIQFITKKLKQFPNLTFSDETLANVWIHHCNSRAVTTIFILGGA